MITDNWIIKDWTNNQVIEDRFETFDDAWDYIFEHYNENDFQELQVVPRITNIDILD